MAFPDKKLMKEWKAMKEEAEKRDHRLLGKQQQLFMFHEFRSRARKDAAAKLILCSAVLEAPSSYRTALASTTHWSTSFAANTSAWCIQHVCFGLSTWACFPDSRERGYQEVRSPLLFNRKLWQTSGEFDII